MKKLITSMTLFFSVIAFASDKDQLILDDPEPRLPQRESTRSEDPELKLEPGPINHQGVENRQTKENMEEVDPIFYDATTSPAELDKAE